MKHPCAMDRRTAVAIGGLGVLGVPALAACSSPGSTGGRDGEESTAGTVVARLADVAVGGSTAVGVAGVPYVVARPEESRVVAFSAVCTHQGCRVAPNGPTLDCPCHGSQFDAFTGEVLQGPAEEALPQLSVVIEGDAIVTA